MNKMEISFPSWERAGSVFKEASESVPNTLNGVVNATTDPNACGAGTGYATVDGAVAIMLTVFGEVMRGTVATSLTEGLAGESEALVATGVAIEGTEAENADAASTI